MMVLGFGMKAKSGVFFMPRVAEDILKLKPFSTRPNVAAWRYEKMIFSL